MAHCGCHSDAPQPGGGDGSLRRLGQSARRSRGALLRARFPMRFFLTFYSVRRRERRDAPSDLEVAGPSGAHLGPRVAYSSGAQARGAEPAPPAAEPLSCVSRCVSCAWASRAWHAGARENPTYLGTIWVSVFWGTPVEVDGGSRRDQTLLGSGPRPHRTPQYQSALQSHFGGTRRASHWPIGSVMVLC